MAAKFEIQQPTPGVFSWVLTDQGRVLAKSFSYTRKASCLKAMESFRAAAPTADIVDRTTSDVKFAPPASVPGKAARTGGRAVGKAASVVADVPELTKSAIEKVVDAVLPTPRRRTRRA
jgi:uncharacterized protein YegP (UPF0339 family)